MGEGETISARPRRRTAIALVAAGAFIPLVLMACGGNGQPAPAASSAPATPVSAGSATDVQTGLQDQVNAGRLDQEVLTDLQANGGADALLVLNEALIRTHVEEVAAAQGVTLTDAQIADLEQKVYAFAKSQVLAFAPGSSVIEDFKSFGVVQVRFPNAAMLLAVLRRPEVAAVTANEVHQTDRAADAAPRLPLSEDLGLIHEPDAAAAGFTGAGTAVAVLDSGVDYRRDAFGSCSAPGQPSDRCRVAVFQHVGGDDGRLDSDTQHMHGTNVSGIVAAVAPQTTLIVLDVADPTRQGGISDTAALRALDWVEQHSQQYHIVATNMSFGSSRTFNTNSCTSPYTGVFDQLRRAGVTPVTASGNSAYSPGTHGFRNGLGPIACTTGAVSVGAVYYASVGGVDYGDCKDRTTQPDQIACFSQSGPNLSLLAPGVAVTAAGVTETGTSQASPHVAGAVAALASKCTGATPDQIERALETSGPQITDARNNVTLHRLDLAAAGQALQAMNACMPGASRPAPPPQQHTQPSGQQGLYDALLKTPFTRRELPAGFSAPDVQAGTASDAAQKYNATGQVNVDVKGPDAGDAFDYIVFDSEANAKAFFEAVTASPDLTLPGMGAPAACISGPVSTSSGQQLGATLCYTQSGATVVRSVSLSSQDTSHGNYQAAASLLKAGLAHLRQVQASIAKSGGQGSTPPRSSR